MVRMKTVSSPATDLDASLSNYPFDGIMMTLCIMCLKICCECRGFQNFLEQNLQL
jgi:hypothetical protein